MYELFYLQYLVEACYKKSLCIQKVVTTMKAIFKRETKRKIIVNLIIGGNTCAKFE